MLVKSAKKLSPNGDLENLGVGSFEHRALNLMLLMKVAPKLLLGGVGKGRLLELNKVRNDLAHAHFEQHPFEDNFRVIKARHHSLKEMRLNQYNEKTITAFAEELEGIAKQMSAVHDFFDVPIPIDEEFAKLTTSKPWAFAKDDKPPKGDSG